MSSKNPEKSLQRSESHLFTSTAKETNRKLLRLSTKTKRMPFLKQENSATPIQLRFKELCGGFLSLHFGFRARDESRKLRWGDVQIQQQNDGQEVLVWLAERGTKTRHGQERGHQRAFQLKIYATNTSRCPVSFYKKFRSHRPVEMNAPESPFYLAVRHNRRSNEEVWYMKAPLGKNEIGKFLSTSSEECWPSQRGKKSNSSFCQENLYFEAP